jgi:hypothetical protein
VLRYRYSDPILRRERILLSDEVFVLRGRHGTSVLDYASESLGLQLAMQRFATQSYTRGPRHTGVIQRPKDAPKWSDKARDNFRGAVDEYSSEGERAGRPLLLEDGMTWASSGITMRDAEFLGTMQHGVADVCRWYRVPQHKIQELLRSTNNNIEQQSIDYVVDSLIGWSVRWEQAIRRDLIINTARFFAEHNIDGLLRGDSKTRAEAYALAVQWGWLTRAEVRKRENLNPIPGLDEPLTPLNMQQGGRRGTDPVPNNRAGGSPSSPAVVSYLRVLVRDAAGRVVRKETAALSKLAESGRDWETGVRDFYVEHAEFVARILRVPDVDAERYAQDRAEHLIQVGPIGLDGFETDTVESLTAATLDRAHDVSTLVDLAYAKSAPLQLPPRVSVTNNVTTPPTIISEGAFHTDVHAPVTIEEGAVAVALTTPPTVIAEGAIRLDVQTPAPVAMHKKVKHDAKGRVTDVFDTPMTREEPV